LIASEGDTSASRLIDDVLPVAETVAIVQVATQLGKYAFARRRPYAYYATTALDPSVDNDSSFWSGHSVLGFAITSAAGTVCHFRHYWTEPYVWGAGVTLSLATEYLRMAADKHWFSDVITGGLVGLGTGLLVPRLMQRSIKIVPVQNGVGIAGAF
jgi:membrane-associated phospholipid phosphatase